MFKAALNPVLGHLRRSGYSFVTPTPATHARVNARSANQYAMCLEDVFGWNRTFRRDLLPTDMFAHLVEAGALINAGPEVFRTRFRVSCVGEDLLVHGAYPTEGRDSVFLGPDTYRFVAALRAALPGLATVRRAVDVGCGSGAAGIVVARQFPEADVFLTDVNDKALACAVGNAEFAGVNNAVVRKSDVLRDLDGRFDLVVANPPYLLDDLKRDYRHGGGQYGEGLSLRIVDEALDKLSHGGTLLLYTGSVIVKGVDYFKQQALAKLSGASLRITYAEIDPDVFGEELEREAYSAADRIAAVLLTVSKENRDA